MNESWTPQKSFDLIDPVSEKTQESVALDSTITRTLAFSGIRDEKLPGRRAILMPKIVFF
jgi:hypothetical protein